jgi:hypothetical protein
MENVNIEKSLPNIVKVEKKAYVSPECQYIQIETEGMLCASGVISGNSDRFGGRFGR